MKWIKGFSDVLLSVCSSFPDTKEQFSDLPFKNGSVSGAMELKRRVSAHCHRSKPQHGEQSGDKLLARRKLFIASGVCLVFMIGEVIGERSRRQTSNVYTFREGGLMAFIYLFVSKYIFSSFIKM